MTHLVTGGAGFIGSHLANTLLAAGETVIAVDDLSGGFADNLHPDVPLVVCDVADLGHLYDAEYVWHLAAYAAEGLSHWVREHNVRNNWLATTHLINLASDVKRFFFTSSMAVYGTQPVPYVEELIPRPEDPYGIAKYSCEQDLWAAHNMFDLPVTIFRPHNVYGPGQNVGDPYRNVVGIFMRQALQERPLTVFGDGRQMRAFSYITDIVEPMISAWHRNKDGVFNIGGEQPITILDLAGRVSRVFGGVPIEHLPERYEVRNAWSDHLKARQVLDFAPHVDLDMGLELMAAWVKSTGIRTTSTPDLEISHGLPDFWRNVSDVSPRRAASRRDVS